MMIENYISHTTLSFTHYTKTVRYTRFMQAIQYTVAAGKRFLNVRSVNIGVWNYVIASLIIYRGI